VKFKTIEPFIPDEGAKTMKRKLKPVVGECHIKTLVSEQDSKDTTCPDQSGGKLEGVSRNRNKDRERKHPDFTKR
jgi:hypothetical protein